LQYIKSAAQAEQQPKKLSCRPVNTSAVFKKGGQPCGLRAPTFDSIDTWNFKKRERQEPPTEMSFIQR
jgi:hypothetical protein